MYVYNNIMPIYSNSEKTRIKIKADLDIKRNKIVMSDIKMKTQITTRDKTGVIYK